MNYSFNLIDEAWIPCLWPDGRSIELGLRDVLLQAHEVREIRGDTPLETAALHRLLLAILHRVFGPAGPSKWKELWKGSQFDAEQVNTYLNDPIIASRFDLFDPDKPFYQPCRMSFRGRINNQIEQVREKRSTKQSLDELLSKLDENAIPDDKKTPITSLIIHAASGNNATLFDHTTSAANISLTPAQAAKTLITSQLFGIGGTSSISENFVDAPAAKGILFFAYGRSLFESLMLNLIRYDEDHPLPTPDNLDCPAWEMDDPFVPVRSQPRGYLDYLTWHNRRIWLYPQMHDGQVVVRHMVWAPGLTLSEDVTDPMKHYFGGKRGTMQPLCFTVERALWRDSNVLLELSSTDKPPEVIRWLARLAQPPVSVLDTTQRYHLQALGLAKSKASLEFLRAERLPLPTTFLLDPNRISDLSHSLQSAEHSAGAIRRATFLLAWLLLYPTTDDSGFNNSDKIEMKIEKGRNIKSNDKDAQNTYRLCDSWAIERIYWNALEPHFHRLIQDLPNNPESATQSWRQEVRHVANVAFETAESYAGGDLRAQRAAALARQQFHIGLAAALGKASSPDNTDGGEKA